MKLYFDVFPLSHLLGPWIIPTVNQSCCNAAATGCSTMHPVGIAVGDSAPLWPLRRYSSFSRQPSVPVGCLPGETSATEDVFRQGDARPGSPYLGSESRQK